MLTGSLEPVELVWIHPCLGASSVALINLPFCGDTFLLLKRDRGQHSILLILWLCIRTMDFIIICPSAYVICTIYSIQFFPYFAMLKIKLRGQNWASISRKLRVFHFLDNNYLDDKLRYKSLKIKIKKTDETFRFRYTIFQYTACELIDNSLQIWNKHGDTYWTNRLHFPFRVYCNRLQMMSQRVKNKK